MCITVIVNKYFLVYRLKRKREIMTAPGSMSPCTIEKDVVDAMKKFRRASNKATLAMLCKYK